MEGRLKIHDGRDILQVLEEGAPHFGEFGVVIHELVVTSDNAGAFFEGKGPVVDFRTLERVLSRCDGDILFVLDALRHLPELADSCLEVRSVTTQIGPLSVSYEGVTIKQLMDFGQAEYKSVGVPNKLLASMLEEGGLPLDVIRERTQGEE